MLNQILFNTFAKIIQETIIQFKAMLLSEKMKELRLQSKLPQRKIAAALDVDTATYCKFEKNVLRISREQLAKFAEYIGEDSDTLTTLWLADEVKKLVGDDKKEIAKDAMDIVYKSIN